MINNNLFESPWLDYSDNFYLNYNIIDYPKNIYFTANVVSEYLKKNNTLFKKYPYAQKFDISTLNNIDWKNTIITFDKHFKIIKAPEPLKQLINLNKRLDYEKADDEIFGAFKIPFIQIKSFGVLILIMTIVLFIKMCIYFDLLYRFRYF